MLIPRDEGKAALKPVKWYRDLATREGRLSAGAFLVEGERAIAQVVESSPDRVLEIVTTAEESSLFPRYAVRIVTERQMESISSTRTPQGIAAVVSIPADTYSDHMPENIGSRVLLLEDVQDPGNVGTLIRTAAAFDYAGVILSGSCADPMSPKCVQSTAGAVLSVWIRRTPRYLEMVKDLKRGGYYVVATALNGVQDTEVLCGKTQLVLALGNEGSGLSEALLKMADYRLRIATMGRKAESLNVAACGAVCMYLSCQGVARQGANLG